MSTSTVPRRYTVRQLAEMAGISVRTLHHYDHIGLLRPGDRTHAGYRLYAADDLLRLQQILFYKELDFSLEDIRQILDAPGFDRVAALQSHRRMLQRRGERLDQLIRTIDKTILKLTEDKMELSDADLYEGFTPEQAERYQREAREMYDPKLVAESERRIRKLSKQQWQAVKEDGHRVTQLIASLADRDPGDPEVQAAIEQHHAWIENFYHCPADIYQGVGSLYTDHPEFRARYDTYRPGLADFMRPAMEYYAEHSL
jgi:DNA-binding transcriptional MerR regulator